MKFPNLILRIFTPHRNTVSSNPNSILKEKQIFARSEKMGDLAGIFSDIIHDQDLFCKARPKTTPDCVDKLAKCCGVAENRWAGFLEEAIKKAAQKIK